MNTAQTLRAAVRSGDRQRLADALASLRAAGFTDRQCYRMALAADPDLTAEHWADLTR